MSSTCFKPEGSSSGRRLYIQVRHSVFTCTSMSSLVGIRMCSVGIRMCSVGTRMCSVGIRVCCVGKNVCYVGISLFCRYKGVLCR
jgi:hypothetical protein